MRFSKQFLVSCLLGLLLVSPAWGQKTRYTVQLEAAPTKAEAKARVNQLKTKDVLAYIMKSVVPGKGTFYRIRVGTFPNMIEAKRFGEDLVRRGAVSSFFVAVYEQPPEEPAMTPMQKPAPAPPPQSQPQPQVAQKEAPKPAPVAAAPKPAPPTPTPVASSTTAAAPPPVKSAPATSGPAAGMARFQDPSVGYSFEYPNYWTGQKLDTAQADEQRVNAGALFKSQEDAAFLNAIWNKLEKANSPDNDNDLIVEIILKSMASSNGTQLKETSRKVVNEGSAVKTFLEMRAAFQTPGQPEPLDFIGKAVIIRASKGILLVVAFYSKDAPAASASIADRIIASVRAPE